MDKISEINRVIAQYFATNKSEQIVPAKDLMPYFIRAGIFTKDDKNGKPIREILRKLDAANELHRIPTVVAERKTQNTNWFFGRNAQVSVPPKAKPTTAQPAFQKAKSVSGRKHSDEHYIIDLCDELLGLKGNRQHRFNFLLGDAGTRLPVDVYYETLNLVIEFNEQQHTKAVKHFDKPDKLTVSGVHRGEQRKIYDKRKRDVLPQHGIKVIDLAYSAFECDNKGKIVRDKVRDINIVKEHLKNFLTK